MNTPSRFEFGIVGSSPFAALLALSLAHNHQASVCLLGKPAPDLRVPHGLSCLTGAVTRPDTIRFFQDADRDTSNLFERTGLQGLFRADVTVASTDMAAQHALRHSRQTALHYHVPVEPLPDNGTGWQGFSQRMTPILSPTGLVSTLSNVLGEHAVSVIGPALAPLRFSGSAGGSLKVDQDEVPIETLVLADDAAIIAAHSTAQVDEHFTRHSFVGWSLARNAQFHWPILIDPAGPACAAVLPGMPAFFVTPDRPEFNDWGPLALAVDAPVEVVARAKWQGLSVADGAPLVGSLKRHGPMVAHFPNTWAPFAAPAVARFLTGNETSDDKAYFGGRGTKAKDRVNAREFTIDAKVIA